MPKTTAKFRNGSIQDFSFSFIASQFLPYITILLKIASLQYKYVLNSLVVLIFISLLLLIDRGYFNISLYILRYNQYRVNNDTNSYMLVSKRRINNFNHIFNLVELNNEILLEV